MQLRYSPYPPRSYTVSYQGSRVGFGMYPPLVTNPAAWNLFWLSYPPLDDLLSWPEHDAGNAPICNSLVSACITTADRPAMFERLTTLNPRVAVQQLVDLGLSTLPPYPYLGPSWRKAMEGRAVEADLRLRNSEPEQVAANCVMPVSGNILPFRGRSKGTQ